MHLAAASQTVDDLKVKMMLSLISDFFVKLNTCLSLYFVLNNFLVLFAVQLLLQFGGKISTADKEGLTPTMWACHFDQLHNLQMLQQALSKIDPQEDAIFTDTDCNGQSVIHWAVKGAGTLECLEVSEV